MMVAQRPLDAHILFYFLLVARQADTNKCNETQSKKKNTGGKISGTEAKPRRRKEQFLTPTCTTRMTMPMVPSRCLLSSSHSSTFSKQPLNGTKACENVHFLKEMCSFSVPEESCHHPVRTFTEKTCIFHMRHTLRDA